MSVSETISLLIEKYSDKISSISKQEDWELGIDEAGRGPVLGPMVYGCCMWPKSLKSELASYGFADSKQLKEEERDLFFSYLELLNNKCLFFDYVILQPQYISNLMLRKVPTNLNEISFQTAFLLIRRSLEKCNISNIYIDTVGKPEAYKQKLRIEFNEYPNLNFEVTEKADSKFPVVSAASIVAKVKRDECIKNWHFSEKINFNRDFGSGYPSDPNTVKWLKDNYIKGLGFPDFVRFSWKTIETAMEKAGLKIKFNSEIEEEEKNCKNSKLDMYFDAKNEKKQGIWIKKIGLLDKFDL